MSQVAVDIYLIELMPKLLVTAFDDEFCDEVAAALVSKGIHIHCGKRVTSIDRHSNVDYLTLDDGKKIKVDMVLVSTGTKPATTMLCWRWSGKDWPSSSEAS